MLTFGFAKLHMDILTMLITSVVSVPKSLLVYDYRNMQDYRSWTNILEFLNNSEISNFVFTHTLRVAEDNKEPDIYSYEYKGPLLALEGSISLNTNKDLTWT